MQKEQFYCIYASSHEYHIPSVDSHSWELFKGTFDEAECYAWDEACQHDDGSHDVDEEDWGDFIERTTSRSVVEYDPTIKGHASLTGYGDVRPEHKTYLINEAIDDVRASEQRLARAKQHKIQLLAELDSEIDRLTVVLGGSELRLEGLQYGD